MWNEPTPEELHRLPRLYETEKTPWRSKLIYEHFFIGGCDWWAAEYDPANRLFFGYAMLHRDYDNAEWGYFSFDEMRAVSIMGLEIDRDLFWRVRKAGEVELIAQAHQRQGRE